MNSTVLKSCVGWILLILFLSFSGSRCQIVQKHDEVNWPRWTLPKPEPTPQPSDDDWSRYTLPKPEPTPQPDGDDYWFRWNLPTWKPFTWQPLGSTTRPDDGWFRWTLPTWKPFTWQPPESTTRRDDGWFRWKLPTWKPFTWQSPKLTTHPDDGWFRWTVPTWKPFAWQPPETTTRPDDGWFRWTLPTWEPFTRQPPESTTRPDDGWFRWTLPTWKPFTYQPPPPDVYNYRKDKSSSINFPLFLTILTPIVVLVLCLKILLRREHCCDASNTYTSTSTAHLPQRASTIPPRSTVSNTTRSPASRVNVFTTEPQPFHGAPNTNITGIPYSDRPPDYTSVVIDNVTEKARFPEVNPEKQDTPPPKYDEFRFPKF